MVIYPAKKNTSMQKEILYYQITEILEHFNDIKIQLLILYPYMGVHQTVHSY